MKALIFDTETTGLLPPSIARDNYQPRIIEFFGHIIDDDGSSIRELEFFCNPGIEISEEITSITGIKKSDVVDAPPADGRWGLNEVLHRNAQKGGSLRGDGRCWRF
jgi:DNA polymerase III alpha subunit (gram-positive type)